MSFEIDLEIDFSVFRKVSLASPLLYQYNSPSRFDALLICNSSRCSSRFDARDWLLIKKPIRLNLDSWTQKFVRRSVLLLVCSVLVLPLSW
jgi:hypothetical protein